MAAALAAPAGADRLDVWALDGIHDVPLDVEVIAESIEDGVWVREITYTSEVVDGNAVRIYGFLAQPTDALGAMPGLIELHGGGGTANRASAAGSARLLGACVLNIDWSGLPARAERVSVADALGDARLFGDPRFVLEDASDFSARHTVAAIVRGVDLLDAQPSVDGDRIGVVGGSWGGFLALLAAGLDGRVRCAVSGFGAGAFRDTYSLCSRPLYAMSEAQREFWLTHVDPVHHAPHINGSVVLLTASNEVHFWLNSAVATFRGLPAGSRLIISPNTVHAAGSGVVWPNHAWFRACLLDGEDWPEITDFRFDGRVARWRVASPLDVSQNRLYFAPGEGNWPGRVWLPVPARAVGDEYVADLPGWLAGVEGDAYPLVTDAARRSVSAAPVHAGGLAIREMSERRDDPGLIDDFSDGIDLWRVALASRGAASLSRAEEGALCVEERRQQDAVIAIETNLITLAAARLGAEAALSLQLDSAGAGFALEALLVQRPGQRGERRFVASVPVEATPGWQPLRVPLSLFADDDGLPDWAEVSQLMLRWPMAAGSSVRLSEVRID